MISFQDITFCPGDGCVKFGTCPRALTPEVHAAAEKWWGEPGPPIARWEKPSALSCYDGGEEVEGDAGASV